MRPQVTGSMQTPRRLPVQVEPVGLSNLFDSLSVNERQEKQKQVRSRKAGLLRNTPVLGFYRSRREGEGAKNVNILL